MRCLPAAVLAFLALSACTGTDTEALPRASAPDSAAAPALETRAEAAGLAPEQAAELERLGVPVYVPDLPDGWTLIEQTAALKSYAENLWPEYELRYRTPQSTCLLLRATPEGMGVVFAQPPPHERDVRVPGVPTDGPVTLGWGVPGERTEGWEDGRVSTERFGTDGLVLSVASDDTDGCRPASPEAAETFASSLRPLDPADDAILIGRVTAADEIYQAQELPAGPDPEAVAMEVFGPENSGEDAQRTTVETLRRRGRFAVLLITTTGRADDSVRDTRTRVALERMPDGWWDILSGGRQVRCQPGRGHSDWSADVCS